MRRINFKNLFPVILIFCVFNIAHAEDVAPPSPSNSVFITEVMYNLQGSDADREWIEVFNAADHDVDLSKWKFSESETNHKLEIFQGSSSLSANGYAIIAQNPSQFLADWSGFSGSIFKSSFSLSNSGETLTLKDENSNEAISVSYSESFGANGDGQSLQTDGPAAAFFPGLPTPGDSLKVAEITPESEPAPETIEAVQSEEGHADEDLLEIMEQEPESVYSDPAISPEISQAEALTETLPQDTGSPEMSPVEAVGESEAPVLQDVQEAEVLLDENILKESEAEAVPEKAEIQKILINEINWAGEEGNQFGEWLELYNPNGNEVDLANWKLYENGGQALILSLTKKIAPHGYYLLERETASHPDPLPEINDDAGKFNGSGLSNSGEFLVLKDANDNTVESLDFSSGWPEGSVKTKQTMQRDGDAWFSAKGTPGALNARDVENADLSNGGAVSDPENIIQADNENESLNVSIRLPEQIVQTENDSPEDSISIKKEILPGDLSFSVNSDGLLEILNDTENEIDLSGFQAISSDKKYKDFTMPQNTIILPGRKITFKNTSI